jgi:hypothetical protein
MAYYDELIKQRLAAANGGNLAAAGLGGALASSPFSQQPVQQAQDQVEQNSENYANFLNGWSDNDEARYQKQVADNPNMVWTGSDNEKSAARDKWREADYDAFTSRLASSATDNEYAVRKAQLDKEYEDVIARRVAAAESKAIGERQATRNSANRSDYEKNIHGENGLGAQIAAGFQGSGAAAGDMFNKLGQAMSSNRDADGNVINFDFKDASTWLPGTLNAAYQVPSGILNMPFELGRSLGNLANGTDLETDSQGRIAGERELSSLQSAAGVASPVLDIVGMLPGVGIAAKGLKTVGKAALGRLAGEVVEGGAKQIGKGIVKGGVPESLTEMAQTGLDAYQGGYDVSADDFINAGILGGVLGGGLGGVGSAASVAAQRTGRPAESVGIDTPTPVDIDAPSIESATFTEMLDNGQMAQTTPRAVQETYTQNNASDPQAALNNLIDRHPGISQGEIDAYAQMLGIEPQSAQIAAEATAIPQQAQAPVAPQQAQATAATIPAPQQAQTVGVESVAVQQAPIASPLPQQVEAVAPMQSPGAMRSAQIPQQNIEVSANNPPISADIRKQSGNNPASTAVEQPTATTRAAKDIPEYPAVKNSKPKWFGENIEFDSPLDKAIYLYTSKSGGKKGAAYNDAETMVKNLAGISPSEATVFKERILKALKSGARRIPETAVPNEVAVKQTPDYVKEIMDKPDVSPSEASNVDNGTNAQEQAESPLESTTERSVGIDGVASQPKSAPKAKAKPKTEKQSKRTDEKTADSGAQDTTEESTDDNRRSNTRNAETNTGGTAGSSFTGARSFDEATQIMEAEFGTSTSGQVRKRIREIVRTGEALNRHEFRALQEIVHRKGLAENTEVSEYMTKLQGISEQFTSNAGATLAFAKALSNIKMRNGDMTATEFKESMERLVPNKSIVTDAVKAQFNELGDVYVVAGTNLKEVQSMAKEVMNNKEATGADLKAATAAVRAAKADIVDIVRQSDVTIMEAINNSGLTRSQTKHLKNIFLNNMFEYRGTYIHNWVDSSILSNPVGRVYDQWNGWQVIAEQAGPLTRAINGLVGKKYGVGVGFKKGSGGAVKRGVKSSVATLRQNVTYRHDLMAASRKGNLLAGRALNATTQTLRQITTAAVELGDIPISAASNAFVEGYYRNDYIDKNKGIKPRKAMVELQAELDVDGIQPIARNFMALEQGLSAQAYGFKTTLRKVTETWLQTKPYFRNHPAMVKNFVGMFDRYIFGFIGVTMTIAKRGASRMTFGLPQFVKWRKAAAELKKSPNSKKAQYAAALELSRAINDAKSTVKMGAVGVGLGMSGLVSVTLGYPDDPSERAYMEANGISPYSLKIGNSYWEISRAAGAWAYPLMAGIMTGQALSQDEDMDRTVTTIEDGVLGMFGLFANASGADSTMTAVTNTMDVATRVYNNPEDFLDTLGEFGVNQGTQLVGLNIPLSSLQNTILSMVYENKKETYDPNPLINALNVLANKTFTRFLLPNELTSTGQFVRNTDPLARLGGAISTQREPTDTFGKEALRLGKKDIFVYPSDTRVSVKDADGNKVGMTGEQQYALQLANGLETNRLLNIAVESDYYKSLKTDEEKATYLRGITTRPEIKNVVNELASKMGLIGEGGYGVSSTMTAEETAVLLQADNFSAAQWANKLSEDPKLAALYYRADYNNKLATGALEPEDKDITKNGAMYKMLKSQFDLDNGVSSHVVYSYGATSNTTIEDLWRREPDTARGIIVYDAMLAAAGLADGSESRSVMKFDSEITLSADDTWELSALISDAAYRAKEAAGTLTPDEVDWQYSPNGNLGFRRAKDQFNLENGISVELDSQYKSISNADWKLLADTDPELYERLWALDVLRTESGVSYKDSNHSVQKYSGYRGAGSGGRGGGGGGGGGAGFSLSSVPSVEDLRAKQYFPKGGSKTSTGTTISGTSKAHSVLGAFDLKPVKTATRGKGIKTEPIGYKASTSVKYIPSKTRQPNMGDTYMSYLKGKPVQDSFKAQRKY